MSEQRVYLRPNAVAEPLVDQWYAWPYIIAPATAAMNLAGRHIKIMESYIKAPQIHAAAVRNPSMLGGPFIDYKGERVDEIRRLLTRTRTERAHLLEFAAAIRQLDEALRTEATGYSLEPLYGRIPGLLRGYLELVYDLNNHPSFRLIEPLLYRSKYYERSAQSLIVSLLQGDDRPFILSTPRLETTGELHLRIPFCDPAIDELFRTESVPQSMDYLQERLGASDGSVHSLERELFRSFFTPEGPPPYRAYRGPGMRWRYFGHACILLETPDVSILLDPTLSYTYESRLSRYTYRDLPEVIDYVLITHTHQDHISLETMIRLRHKIRTIVVPRNSGGALHDPSLKLMLKNLGFENVIEADELETIELENGSITTLPFFGEHADLSVRAKLAYLVRLGNHKLLFAADSCNIEPVLYLGMECDGAPLSWLYGPLMTQPLPHKMDQSRRLSGSNYERALGIVERFHFREVYVYAMGQEPWLTYISSKKYTDQSIPIIDSNLLIDACRKRGITAERLFGEKEILLPG
jgi:L-ascorbate metabolism protein UlaG (beta-lactamase superfamily)